MKKQIVNQALVMRAKKAISVISQQWKKFAIDAIERGDFKAQIDALYKLDGKFNGFSAFMHYDLAVENEVGQVITAFNVWITVQICTEVLIKNGYETVEAAVSSPNKMCNYVANSIKEFMHMYRKNLKNVLGDAAIDITQAKGRSYKSPIKKDGNKESWTVIRISSKVSREIEKQILALDDVLYLDELYQVALDQSSNKRLSGELTIDTTKKPSILVIAGILGLLAMQDIKQIGKGSMEVAFAWNDIKQGEHVITEQGCPRLLYKGKDIVTSEYHGSKYGFVPTLDCKPCDFDDLRVGGQGSWYEEKKDGDACLQFCDYVQILKRPLFQMLCEWADRMGNKFTEENVRQLSEIELNKIFTVAERLKETGVVNALTALKGEWQTATNTARKEEEAAAGWWNKTRKINALEQAKADKRMQMSALSNKARLMFAAAEEINGIKISAADKMRLLWAAVLGNKDDIEWESISGIVTSLLPAEFSLWLIDAFGNEQGSKTVTRDKLTVCGPLKSATDKQLLRLDGCKMKFVDSTAYLNGKAIAYAATEGLDGIHTVRAIPEDGTTKLFVEIPLVDLIEIPEVDITQNFIKLQTAKNEKDIKTVVNKMMTADEVFVAQGVGNPLCTIDNSGQITKIGGYLCLQQNQSPVANRVFNIDWHNKPGHPGICGKPAFVKIHEYVDNKKRHCWTAFAVLEECRPALYKELLQINNNNVDKTADDLFAGA